MYCNEVWTFYTKWKCLGLLPSLPKGKGASIPVTSAMCRKPPAVNGRIHDVKRPSAIPSVPLAPNAVKAPANPTLAVPNWARAASQRPNPNKKSQSNKRWRLAKKKFFFRFVRGSLTCTHLLATKWRNQPLRAEFRVKGWPWSSRGQLLWTPRKSRQRLSRG